MTGNRHKYNMEHIRPDSDITVHSPHLKTLFLAGSIALDKAEDWQLKVVNDIAPRHIDIAIYNPRCSNWDNSINCVIGDHRFKTQVLWEINAIKNADRILMYFDKNTESPITLLELGMIAASTPDRLVVVCPDGFWRKGNVDIVCDLHGVQMADTLYDAIDVSLSHI